jgi:glycosyltransferase involved in cell wall biosynthesis
VSGRSVVVVGHDASHTGAPIALRSTLRWVLEHTDDRPTLVLVDGGPLVTDYRSTVDTIVLATRRSAAVGRAVAGLRSVRPGARSPGPVVGLRRVPPADVVLANTLASLPVAARLVRRPSLSRTRLVCHVHELDGVAARVLPDDAGDRVALVERVDRWIAAGPAVAEMLVQRWGVNRDAVCTVDGFIEAPTVTPTASAAARARLGVPERSTLVVSSGSLIRRKGPERFVDLMAVLAEHPSRPVGRWLGGAASGAVHQELLADIGRLARPDRVRWVGSVDDHAACLAAADVVVSTAIEDPYPLVALEAGALGVPVVGHDAGGLAELLGAAGQSDAVVPVGDLVALAASVAELLEDEEQRSRRGRALAEQVLSRHLVQHRVPSLWSAVVS